MAAATRSPRETIEQFLRAAVSASPGDMADCYAENVIVEIPFAAAAVSPSRVETTREELRARFQAGRANRRYKSLSDVAIHETADPEVIIAEYQLHGEMTATGEPFRLRFAMVVKIAGGCIVHSRDYSDPIAGARLLGKLPDLVSALT